MAATEVAVITGGGSGLGRSTAIEMGRRGVAVVVVGRTAASLDETAAEVKGAGGEALAVQADVRSEDQVEAAFETAKDAFGVCTVLVHCAAVHGSPMRLVDVPLKEWQAVYESNLLATFLTSRAALRQMLPERKGALVFVSSPGVLRGFPLAAPYAATKSALLGFVRTLAAEVSPDGIRVNVLTPGAMSSTALYESAAPAIAKGMGIKEEEMLSALEGMAALRRAVTVEEMGRAALYLALDATAMTGQNLVADCGLTN